MGFQRWLNTAKELLSLPTAPLAEHYVADWLAAFATERGILADRDRWGNLLLHYCNGRGIGRPPAFCAHMDHPGFVADRTRRNGVLVALWRGSVPPELFPNAAVRFFSGGSWIRGRDIRSCKRHRTAKPRVTDIEVRSAVQPGSVGMWDYPDPSRRGPRLYARGMDDVSAVAAIACVLDEACRRRVPGEFYALFTRAEESGFLGAIGACQTHTLPKRCVIVALENSRALADAPMGGGVVVRVGDRMSIFTPAVTSMLCAAAADLAKRDRGFAWQRRLMDGGTCESSVYTCYGYDAGGLCLPLGNYHNVNWDRMTLGPESIDVNDFAGMVKLLLHLVRRGAALPETNTIGLWEQIFEQYGKELRTR